MYWQANFVFNGDKKCSFTFTKKEYFKEHFLPTNDKCEQWGKYYKPITFYNLLIEWMYWMYDYENSII